MTNSINGKTNNGATNAQTAALNIIGGKFIYAPQDGEEIRVTLSEHETLYKLVSDEQKTYCLTRPDFFKLVNAERARKKDAEDSGTEYVKAINFAIDEEAKVWVIMPPDEKSAEICSVLRNSVNTERLSAYRKTRCIVDGATCHGKCHLCGRSQEAGYVREACPLSDACPYDCGQCPNLRNAEGDLSYESSQEMGFELPDANAPSTEDVIRALTNKEMRQVVKNALTENEYKIIVYTLYNDKTIADYARKSYKPEYGKFKSYEQALNRLQKKALKKLAPLLKEYLVD